MPDLPKISLGLHETPCYVPALDEVKIPDVKYFFNSDAFYAAYFHELIHNAARMIMPHEIDFMLLLLHLRCIHTE